MSSGVGLAKGVPLIVGRTVGIVDGMLLGLNVGKSVGLCVLIVGKTVGVADGMLLGSNVGKSVGLCVIILDGDGDGRTEGISVKGRRVGDTDEVALGTSVGKCDGLRSEWVIDACVRQIHHNGTRITYPLISHWIHHRLLHCLHLMSC